MNEQTMKALAWMGVAVGLMVAARQIVRTQAAVLGLSPAMSQAALVTGAGLVLRATR